VAVAPIHVEQELKIYPWGSQSELSCRVSLFFVGHLKSHFDAATPEFGMANRGFQCDSRVAKGRTTFDKRSIDDGMTQIGRDSRSIALWF
jgi:hypothetical protein